MTNYFAQYFDHHADFEFRDGVFFQRKLTAYATFEKTYTDLRRREGRLLDDGQLKALTETDKAVSLGSEWNTRLRSARKLCAYLRRLGPERIVEVGCGNGWLTKTLQRTVSADCCGVDVNATELLQAARTDLGGKTTYVYADITSAALATLSADIVVVASAIQYFPDLKILLTALNQLLRDGGEIHIVDSPVYEPGAVASAQDRSRRHFREQNSEAMANHYFHHSWVAFHDFNFSLLHDPGSLNSRLFRSVGRGSPFPWIRITKHSETRHRSARGQE